MQSKMHFSRYTQPTLQFPYKIKTRLTLLAIPKKQIVEEEAVSHLTPYGVSKYALEGPISYRVNEAAYPYLRQLLYLKRTYKHMFDEERLERITRKIEASNATIYSKLASCNINLKSQDPAAMSYSKKTKKGWNDNDWKKHTEYFMKLCKPKRVFVSEPFIRREPVPLATLLPRIQTLVQMPETKIYRRLSQDEWYKDPTKVAPKALKYVISDRVKKLAEPKKLGSD